MVALRLLGVAACVTLVVVVQLVGGGAGGMGAGSSVSHASHLGGFIMGLLAGMVLLPDAKAARCNKVWAGQAGCPHHRSIAPNTPGHKAYAWAPCNPCGTSERGSLLAIELRGQAATPLVASSLCNAQ